MHVSQSSVELLGEENKTKQSENPFLFTPDDLFSC